ncbi:MIZ/SP-RING zinc finger [Teladorsagia circumcincta]|uniref:MIZ/SP-RING zinc finger n=1 Tax=Teladorsagia circumcincta TaxID=45464 RepID=A0A2G9UEC5_TELCI|nr:MIZ/SP-RING zinc finger [Teladorsagia circumcincta]
MLLSRNVQLLQWAWPVNMIASMRVNELQTVLSMFKMPKLGKKQELIQRCTDLLRTPSVQMQVANQVKLMIGKGNRVAPYPIPVRGYVPNGGMMNGNANGYAGYRGSQMMHPMPNSLHQQAVIPTNKPNVEPKRPSRPVDITQQCLNVRDASRPLRLLIEWTGDKRVWAVAVYLVYRLTSDILRDRAIGTYTGPTYGNKEAVDHHQSEHVTRDVIRSRLSGGNDDDIAMAQLKISLLCPLSRTRISLPARCKKCPHLQCFDLYNYLQMNEKRPTWRCPVCSDWAPYKLLIIDA